MRPVVTSAVKIASRRGFLGAMIAFCGLYTPVLAQSDTQSGTTVAVMSAPEALSARRAGTILLIDIRRPEEWAQTGVAEGAVGLDMTSDSFVSDLITLRQTNPDKALALICRTGNRTGHVTSVLAKQGFPGLVDVREGMVGGRNGPGWLTRGLPIYAGTAGNMAAARAALLP
ncbi:MAG: rhodanese-like domain-containing protein [Pelagimonas sp.]|nr:rhodanese-like domain-containing protein [Pelagimonas sp.]